jgi:hypothetical protein
MGRTFFALASVTALTGLVVAACTSVNNPLEPFSDGGGVGRGDAAVDAAKRLDAGPVEETGTGVCPSNTEPITAKDIDNQLTWLAPAPFQNACTHKNLVDLEAFYKTVPPGSVVRAAEINKVLGATCAACAISPIDGPTWQVFADDSKSGYAFDNHVGSCFAQLENADCGRKSFQWSACLDAMCPFSECGGEKEIVACKEKVRKQQCKEVTEAYVIACPRAATQLPVCSDRFTSLTVSCAGGP